MVKLFISGFPLDMPEIDIVQLVDPYGLVKTIKIVRDKVTKSCKGYAFIEMASAADAQNVIEALDGTTFGDRQLSLRQAVEKPAPEVPKPFILNNYQRVGLKNDPVRKKRPRKG